MNSPVVSDLILSNLKPEYAGKRMLFLPGGVWQVPVIRLARQLGFYVTCADGTPQPPGFAAADEGVGVRLQDIGALVEIGRQRRVDVVMTEQTDFAVPLVAQVARALGLPGLPVEVALAATHKGRMRERLQEAGIRQPRFRVCRTPDEVAAAITALGLPLFHKPADGQSSRGIGILRSPCPTAVRAALQRSLAASQAREAIFEEVLHGTECTVEGFVVRGRPRTLAISSKEHFDDLPGVARTLTYPADFPEPVLERIAAANEAAARALGIPFGITHAEFMVDADGQPWLVEMAARGGGSFIASHIVPALTGFSPILGLIRTLMGSPPDLSSFHPRAAQLRFLRLPPGRRIERFVNLRHLQRQPGVLELLFLVPEGAIVPPVEDDRSRHGLVITVADSRKAAVDLALSIEQNLVIDLGHRAAA